MTPTQIERKYKPRAMKLMRRIQEALAQEAAESQDDGLIPSEPSAYKDEELRIDMGIGPEGDSISVTLEFCFSERWDGEKGGVNFSVSIVHESGRIVGGLTPYNYTDQVWVPRKDHEAVEERFGILEDADPGELVAIIAQWRKRNEK